MPLMSKARSFTMGFCPDCHSDPGPQLRPANEIFNTEWHRTRDTPSPSALLSCTTFPAASDGLFDMSPLTGRRLWRSAQALGGRSRVSRAGGAEFPSLCARPGWRIAAARAATDGCRACFDGFVRLRFRPTAGWDVDPRGAISAQHYSWSAELLHNSPCALTAIRTRHRRNSQHGAAISVQGNPHHPSSLGAADAFSIAMCSTSMIPHRAWGPTADGMPADHQSIAVGTSHRAQRRGDREVQDCAFSPARSRRPRSHVSSMRCSRNTRRRAGINGNPSAVTMFRVARSSPTARRWNSRPSRSGRRDPRDRQ